MLASTHPTIQTALVEILAAHGATKGDRLYSLLTHAHPCTKQGMYRTLRKLMEIDVVIKHRNYYTLSICWFRSVQQFVRTASSQFLSEPHIYTIVPTEEKHTWTFENLKQLNYLLAQVITSMAYKRQQAISLTYTPHQWYDLLWSDANKRFIETFTQFVHHDYVVVGGKTALDQYSASIQQTSTQSTCHLLHEGHALSKIRNKFICVIDDLVLTITLSQEIANAIDALYDAEEKPNKEAIAALMQRPSKIRMVLKQDKQMSARWKKKFSQLFGRL